MAGALYTDVHAVIPTKTILAIAAVLVAITFIVAAIMGRWRLPIIGTAMLLVTVIVAGGIYPFIVQQYQVIPSEKTLEREFIQKNIEMTRKAYGLDSVEETAYDVAAEPAEERPGQGQRHHHEHPPAGPEPGLGRVRPAAAVPDRTTSSPRR